jgi:leader peptidase (prepilin peptidase)/N-methyltransferase
MLTIHLFELIGLLAGLLFGSFLNVLIARVPRGESVLSPGSHCRACNHAIRPWDNIPVVSWLLLRGRCRNCGARISWQYPLVEVVSGLWCMLIGNMAWNAYDLPNHVMDTASEIVWQDYISILGIAMLGLILIGLIVIDWQTQRLPDVFTYSGIGAGLFLICTQTLFLLPGQNQIIFASKHLRLSSPGSFSARGNVFLTGTESLIFGRIAAICGAALLLLFVRWAYRAVRHREGLGLGDVKLLAMIAAFLGFGPAMLTLFLGTLLASLYGAFLLARGRAGALTRLPFGSFLGVAGLAAALFGEDVITWYIGLFH